MFSHKSAFQINVYHFFFNLSYLAFISYISSQTIEALRKNCKPDGLERILNEHVYNGVPVQEYMFAKNPKEES